MKRLGLSILGGLIAAIICAIGRKTLIPTITLADLMISALGNRILIGVVIGVSRIKINSLLHGGLIGLIVTLSYSIGMLVNQNINGFIIYTMMGIIFGVMIEMGVAVIGKAKVV